MGVKAGLDAGSVSVKLALVGEDGEKRGDIYRRHGGRPLLTALDMLRAAVFDHGDLDLAVTGSAGKLAAEKLGVVHVNELLAHAVSTARLYPGVSTLIEMGGEDSKLIILENGVIKDFALNSVCAAGTGSFLDQQAERIRLSIQEFSDLALTSKNPPRLAGRCSVFAKSDMIHLQQIATPVNDIVAGLCFSVARNFKGSIVRNRPTPPKVAFMGGVALNQGMIRAFTEVFGLEPGELVIPDPPTGMGALGAALKAAEDGTLVRVDLERLNSVGGETAAHDKGRDPLVVEGDGFSARHLSGLNERIKPLADGPRIPAFLGIDIGSISTCLAVVDEQGEVLCKRYLRTASRPIEAVLAGLREIDREIGAGVEIKGVGSTGSGRYMIADFISADVVKNEITAQARGAAHIDPGVDTIFEIGGQDSKYIRLKDGIITDFEMNKACAAGTGSFLEEQAEKLEISIKDEFANLALASHKPCRLGERCTVFMENSLQHSLQRGAEKGDLLGGLAYSIVENYINRVVNGRSIGQNIFFQGGTAFNKSVVAAFEKYLGVEVTVPPHHDNTGAIGMGLIARDHMRAAGLERSSFKGFDLADKSYAQSSFECKGCENRCEINRVRIEGEKDYLYYGGRCEKYDIRRSRKNSLPDLFGFRQDRLERSHLAREARFKESGGQSERGAIGLPRAFFFHDYLPYYSTLLWELGFEVALSPRTGRGVIGLGAQSTLADTCFPIKASLGHVRHLLEQGVDRIFMPSFINMASPESSYEFAHACPLTQSFPYQLRTAFPQAGIVAPIVKHRHGRDFLAANLLEELKPFGVGKAELARAMARAEREQGEFFAAIRAKGDEVLGALSPEQRALVIIGRPYNAFDMGLNLEIPKKLASLDVLSIPMDFLPEEDVHSDWPEMYWRSGQRILGAARTVRRDPRLNALCIGNFSCGPDSFINKFFDKEMQGKPYLHIEIDEHSADAGVITRCEAFLDSLEMQARMDEKRPASGPQNTPKRQTFEPVVIASGNGKKRFRKVYLPSMCDHAFALRGAFRSCGVEAEVLPETDEEAISLGRKHVSGKECYPFAVTTGDMLKKVLSPGFDSKGSAFFMPSGTGPCRFGQYNVMQRMILDRVGFGHVPIFAPNQDVEFYKELGMVGGDFSRRSWEGVIAIDLLTKCLHETRPYEKRKGESDAAYKRSLEALARALAQSNGSGPDLVSALSDIRKDFEEIERRDEKKPLVGIVGEIFVRSNRFSNENLVRQVEELGGEAWLAPIDEWIYYVNWGAFKNAQLRREWKRMVQLGIKNHFQRRIAHKLESVFNGFLKTIHDPGTKDILDNASHYLHHTFRGEAVLSVGKSGDMVRRGAKGMINAMPFGCMPGTVVTSIMRGFSKEHGVPCISIPFDGSASPTMRLQLEAFMEQAAGRM